jgi:hypothetical protein
MCRYRPAEGISPGRTTLFKKLEGINGTELVLAQQNKLTSPRLVKLFDVRSEANPGPGRGRPPLLLALSGGLHDFPVKILHVLHRAEVFGNLPIRMRRVNSLVGEGLC